MADVLGYAPPSRPRLSKRRAKWLIAIAALAVLGWLAHKYAPGVLSHLEQRRLLKAALAAQTAAMQCTLSPQTVAYSDDASEVASLSGAGSGHVLMPAKRLPREPQTAFLYRDMEQLDAVGLQVGQWATFWKACQAGWHHGLAPRDAEPIAFLHGRRSPGGNERLLVVEIGPRPTFVVNVLSPGTAQSAPRRLIGWSTLGFSRLADRPLRVLAGQADANDRAHFTFDYLYDGRRGTVDASLRDDDTITFSSRTVRVKSGGHAYYTACLDAAWPAPAPQKPIREIDASDLPWRSDDRSLSAVALSPDGRVVAAGGRSLPNYAYLWDVETGARNGSAPVQAGRKTFVPSLAFSADGSLLAIGTGEGLCVWDVAHQRMRHVLSTGSVVDQLAFRPRREEMLIGTRSRGLQLWNIAEGRLVREIPVPDPRSFAMDPTGSKVATSSRGKMPTGTPLRLWDLDTGRELTPPPIDPVTYTLVLGQSLDHFSGLNLAWSPDGKVILMAHNAIRAVDASTGAELWMRTVEDQYPFAPVFSPDGRLFAVAGFHGGQVFDFPGASRVRTYRSDQDMWNRPLSWSGDSKRLATLSGRTTICIWDVDGKPGDR